MPNKKLPSTVTNTAYNQGLEEGKALIRANYSHTDDSDDADILLLAEENWPAATREVIEEIIDDGTVEDCEAVAKNYIDGVEDGIKTELHRWLREFKQAL